MSEVVESLRLLANVSEFVRRGDSTYLKSVLSEYVALV
jgi:hypothetical protein